MTNRPEDTEQTGERRPSPVAGVAYQGAFKSVFSILIGAGLGYAADRYFETGPWCMLLGLLLGFVAFILRLVRLGRQIEDRDTKSVGMGDKDQT